MMGSRTGHRALSHKRPPFKLGWVDSPRCKRCLKEESATHMLYDCEAVAYLKFYHMGNYFKEPRDYHDSPTKRIPRFIRSEG
jgi:hypothetical protein